MEDNKTTVQEVNNRVGGLVNPVNKAKYEYLLSLEELPVVSPFNGRSITDFHHDILRFMKRDASEETRKKLVEKYQTLYYRLMNPEYNKDHYIEALILDNIYNKRDKISNYSGRMLLKLYLYFTKYYSLQVSFNKDVVKFLRDGFSSVNLHEDFVGTYLFEYPTEITRCLEDAAAKKYKLKPEELKYIESIYDTTSDKNKSLINKIYKDVYGVGKSIGAADSLLKKDFEKLYEYISGLYEEKYHKPFSIIDMYLITNVQMEDFASVCDLGIEDKEKVVALYRWFKNSYSSMYKQRDYMASRLSMENALKKFSAPSAHLIKGFMDGSFGDYAYTTHTKEEAIKAYETLLDLNKKYGVKVDQFTYLAMLNSVVLGEEQIYYKVGRYHKPYLDKTSHVQVESSPMFTRRIKNEG